MFGVDISSSSVKMVELAEASKGSYRIERYAIETLPRDAVVDGNITNLEAVAEAVKRAWKRMGTRHQVRRHGIAGGCRHHEKDHRPGRPA